MNELSKRLRNHFFNRTIRAACSFGNTNYCDDFEPQDVVSVLRYGYKARIEELKVFNDHFGRPDEETGNFDGFLGDIQKGAYDVALAHLGIVEERFRVIGFTRPYSVEAVRFAVHKGGARSITPALVKPFKADLWLALMFLVVICTICIIYEARLANVKTSISRILLILLEVALQKSSAQISVAFRRPILFWTLLTFILANWYNASVQSFLTSPALLPVISTLEELSQALGTASGLKFCLNREGFAEHVVETGTSDLLRRINTRVRSDPDARSDLTRCCERLRLGKENLVTIVEGARIQPAADAVLNNPSVEVSQDQFGIIAIAAAASKDSESLFYFDRLIGSLFETGVFQRRIRSRQNNSILNEETLSQGVGVDVLTKLGAPGYVASVIVLMVEIGISSHRRRVKAPPSAGTKKRTRRKAGPSKKQRREVDVERLIRVKNSMMLAYGRR